MAATTIKPEDVMEGADMTHEDMGAALVRFGEAFGRNEDFGIGNIEWLERLAQNMRNVHEDFTSKSAIDMTAMVNERRT